MCLESPYYEQINIFNALIIKVSEVWSKLTNDTDEVKSSSEDDICENAYFEKMKFENMLPGEAYYSDNYEMGVITDRILY